MSDSRLQVPGWLYDQFVGLCGVGQVEAMAVPVRDAVVVSDGLAAACARAWEARQEWTVMFVDDSPCSATYGTYYLVRVGGA